MVLLDINIYYIFLFLMGFLVITIIMKSWHNIAPDEVGLVTKIWSWNKLQGGQIIAFNGEAGYQADLLMPGWNFKFWPLYKVEKHSWVQIQPGQIGIVMAQIGTELPQGAKSATYKDEFGQFTDIKNFIENGGQRGIQRRVIEQGSTLPLHPIAFIVLTKDAVYGLPINDDLAKKINHQDHDATLKGFGLYREDLLMIEVGPRNIDGKIVDMVGIVTTYEGATLPENYIAGRIGKFDDVQKAYESEISNNEIIEIVLGNKNHMHKNYQDFQKFLDLGGYLGLQHDPLLAGQYALNPFLVKVTLEPMLVVEQGEVAVVKSYVGLPTKDISGSEFKFGSLVRPGSRGIWSEPVRTGKYAINSRCYKVNRVPTAIMTLNWADAVSTAHKFDKELKTIVAKSQEGFVFNIDLQVQIHVPDTQASKVISSVGDISTLINDVLQAAVGNHFRNTLQGMPAVDFINQREKVQNDAFQNISEKLQVYNVETRGVYIQDVIFPEELVVVLKEREIAQQEIETFKRKKDAQEARIDTEAATGKAEMQRILAQSSIEIEIKENNAKARVLEADGEAQAIQKIGDVQGAKIIAIGRANAEAYKLQADVLGNDNLANILLMEKVGSSNYPLVPKVLSIGSSSGNDNLGNVITGILTDKIAGISEKIHPRKNEEIKHENKANKTDMKF